MCVILETGVDVIVTRETPRGLIVFNKPSDDHIPTLKVHMKCYAVTNRMACQSHGYLLKVLQTR